MLLPNCMANGLAKLLAPLNNLRVRRGSPSVQAVRSTPTKRLLGLVAALFFSMRCCNLPTSAAVSLSRSTGRAIMASPEAEDMVGDYSRPAMLVSVTALPSDTRARPLRLNILDRRAIVLNPTASVSVHRFGVSSGGQNDATVEAWLNEHQSATVFDYKFKTPNWNDAVDTDMDQAIVSVLATLASIDWSNSPPSERLRMTLQVQPQDVAKAVTAATEDLCSELSRHSAEYDSVSSVLSTSLSAVRGALRQLSRSARQSVTNLNKTYHSLQTELSRARCQVGDEASVTREMKRRCGDLAASAGAVEHIQRLFAFAKENGFVSVARTLKSFIDVAQERQQADTQRTSLDAASRLTRAGIRAVYLMSEAVVLKCRHALLSQNAFDAAVARANRKAMSRQVADLMRTMFAVEEGELRVLRPVDDQLILQLSSDLKKGCVAAGISEAGIKQLHILDTFQDPAVRAALRGWHQRPSDNDTLPNQMGSLELSPEAQAAQERLEKVKQLLATVLEEAQRCRPSPARLVSRLIRENVRVSLTIERLVESVPTTADITLLRQRAVSLRRQVRNWRVDQQARDPLNKTLGRRLLHFKELPRFEEDKVRSKNATELEREHAAVAWSSQHDERMQRLLDQLDSFDSATSRTDLLVRVVHAVALQAKFRRMAYLAEWIEQQHDAAHIGGSGEGSTNKVNERLGEFATLLANVSDNTALATRVEKLRLAKKPPATVVRDVVDDMLATYCQQRRSFVETNPEMVGNFGIVERECKAAIEGSAAGAATSFMTVYAQLRQLVRRESQLRTVLTDTSPMLKLAAEPVLLSLADPVVTLLTPCTAAVRRLLHLEHCLDDALLERVKASAQPPTSRSPTKLPPAGITADEDLLVQSGLKSTSESSSSMSLCFSHSGRGCTVRIFGDAGPTVLRAYLEAMPVLRRLLDSEAMYGLIPSVRDCMPAQAWLAGASAAAIIHVVHGIPTPDTVQVVQPQNMPCKPQDLPWHQDEVKRRKADKLNCQKHLHASIWDSDKRMWQTLLKIAQEQLQASEKRVRDCEKQYNQECDAAQKQAFKAVDYELRSVASALFQCTVQPVVEAGTVQTPGSDVAGAMEEKEEHMREVEVHGEAVQAINESSDLLQVLQRMGTVLGELLPIQPVHEVVVARLVKRVDECRKVVAKKLQQSCPYRRAVQWLLERVEAAHHAMKNITASYNTGRQLLEGADRETLSTACSLCTQAASELPNACHRLFDVVMKVPVKTQALHDTTNQVNRCLRLLTQAQNRVGDRHEAQRVAIQFAHRCVLELVVLATVLSNMASGVALTNDGKLDTLMATLSKMSGRVMTTADLPTREEDLISKMTVLKDELIPSACAVLDRMLAQAIGHVTVSPHLVRLHARHSFDTLGTNALPIGFLLVTLVRHCVVPLARAALPPVVAQGASAGAGGPAGAGAHANRRWNDASPRPLTTITKWHLLQLLELCAALASRAPGETKANLQFFMQEVRPSEVDAAIAGMPKPSPVATSPSASQEARATNRSGSLLHVPHAIGGQRGATTKPTFSELLARAVGSAVALRIDLTRSRPDLEDAAGTLPPLVEQLSVQVLKLAVSAAHEVEQGVMQQVRFLLDDPKRADVDLVRQTSEGAPEPAWNNVLMADLRWPERLKALLRDAFKRLHPLVHVQEVDLARWLDKPHILFSMLSAGIEESGQIMCIMHQCSPRMLSPMTLVALHQQHCKAVTRIFNNTLHGVLQKLPESADHHGGGSATASGVMALIEQLLTVEDDLILSRLRKRLIQEMQDALCGTSELAEPSLHKGLKTMVLAVRKITDEVKKWHQELAALIDARYEARKGIFQRVWERGLAAWHSYMEMYSRWEAAHQRKVTRKDDLSAKLAAGILELRSRLKKQWCDEPALLQQVHVDLSMEAEEVLNASKRLRTKPGCPDWLKKSVVGITRKKELARVHITSLSAMTLAGKAKRIAKRAVLQGSTFELHVALTKRDLDDESKRHVLRIKQCVFMVQQKHKHVVLHWRLLKDGELVGNTENWFGRKRQRFQHPLNFADKWRVEINVSYTSLAQVSPVHSLPSVLAETKVKEGANSMGVRALRENIIANMRKLQDWRPVPLWLSRPQSEEELRQLDNSDARKAQDTADAHSSLAFQLMNKLATWATNSGEVATKLIESTLAACEEPMKLVTAELTMKQLGELNRLHSDGQRLLTQLQQVTPKTGLVVSNTPDTRPRVVEHQWNSGMVHCLEQIVRDFNDSFCPTLDPTYAAAYRVVMLGEATFMVSATTAEDLNEKLKLVYSRCKLTMHGVVRHLSASRAGAMQRHCDRAEHLASSMSSIVQRKRERVDKLHEALRLVRPKAMTSTPPPEADVATALSQVDLSQGSTALFITATADTMEASHVSLCIDLGACLLMNPDARSNPKREFVVHNKTSEPLLFRFTFPAEPALSPMLVSPVDRFVVQPAASFRVQCELDVRRVPSAARVTRSFTLELEHASAAISIPVKLVAVVECLKVWFDTRDAVDFGDAVAGGNAVERRLRVRSGVQTPLLIKTDTAAPLALNARLTVNRGTSFTLPGGAEHEIRVSMQPGEAQEMLAGVVRVGVGSSNCVKSFDVNGRVCQPVLALLDGQDVEVIGNERLQLGLVEVNTEQHRIIRIRNDSGCVAPIVLRAVPPRTGNSSVMISPEALTLRPGEVGAVTLTLSPRHRGVHHSTMLHVQCGCFKNAWYLWYEAGHSDISIKGTSVDVHAEFSKLSRMIDAAGRLKRVQLRLECLNKGSIAADVTLPNGDVVPVPPRSVQNDGQIEIPVEYTLGSLRDKKHTVGISLPCSAKDVPSVFTQCIVDVFNAKCVLKTRRLRMERINLEKLSQEKKGNDNVFPVCILDRFTLRNNGRHNMQVELAHADFEQHPVVKTVRVYATHSKSKKKNEEKMSSPLRVRPGEVLYLQVYVFPRLDAKSQPFSFPLTFRIHGQVRLLPDGTVSASTEETVTVTGSVLGVGSKASSESEASPPRSVFPVGTRNCHNIEGTVAATAEMLIQAVTRTKEVSGVDTAEPSLTALLQTAMGVPNAATTDAKAVDTETSSAGAKGESDTASVLASLFHEQPKDSAQAAVVESMIVGAGVPPQNGKSNPGLQAAADALGLQPGERYSVGDIAAAFHAATKCHESRTKRHSNEDEAETKIESGTVDESHLRRVASLQPAERVLDALRGVSERHCRGTLPLLARALRPALHSPVSEVLRLVVERIGEVTRQDLTEQVQGVLDTAEHALNEDAAGVLHSMACRVQSLSQATASALKYAAQLVDAGNSHSSSEVLRATRGAVLQAMGVVPQDTPESISNAFRAVRTLKDLASKRSWMTNQAAVECLLEAKNAVRHGSGHRLTHSKALELAEAAVKLIALAPGCAEAGERAATILRDARYWLDKIQRTAPPALFRLATSGAHEVGATRLYQRLSAVKDAVVGGQERSKIPQRLGKMVAVLFDETTGKQTEAALTSLHEGHTQASAGSMRELVSAVQRVLHKKRDARTALVEAMSCIPMAGSDGVVRDALLAGLQYSAEQLSQREVLSLLPRPAQTLVSKLTHSTRAQALASLQQTCERVTSEPCAVATLQAAISLLRCVQDVTAGCAKVATVASHAGQYGCSSR